ncbi:hypothetical protein [Paraglaciecola sp.]|uniref:IS66 family insertion sequence element accessory protein TnpA n=1 Tax=Paraglaciecola sp. TaxID=1920173 RepID=UPI00326375D0
MKHKTLEGWRESITQQKSSGLSIVDFCQKLRLSTSSFYKFRGQSQQQVNPPRFVKAGKPATYATIHR